MLLGDFFDRLFPTLYSMIYIYIIRQFLYCVAIHTNCTGKHLVLMLEHNSSQSLRGKALYISCIINIIWTFGPACEVVELTPLVWRVPRWRGGRHFQDAAHLPTLSSQ